MQDHAPVLLADYAPYPYRIEGVDLTFRLDPKATRVTSRIRFAPNPARPGRHDLVLDGENLRLIGASIDGVALAPKDHAVTATGLTVHARHLPDGPFTWQAEVEIAPIENVALEGLYMSHGMYCTQCEAEGFRKITFYPDRPDVMARFTVRLESDLPVLLSNGNPSGQGADWAEWTDPWPKPAYLFALVAGDLVAHRGQFTTMSGKTVALNIWVRDGDQDRCAFALGALQRAMTWDEVTYGREYDLDVFNLVAVDDFNMGAMENKGLNIFNSKWVLASADTATDGDFERIEGIIAHEYFHNWTGNRITCRDWFQLCLKEGLTVFRDQQFTAAMRSAPVKRIEDVLTLRARQFREDMGPLAHPVRPERYVEINNFYTATVYEKGAEVIGMLKRLVGDGAYATALDLYFARHDGDAATIEDWLRVFEDVTGRDLTQFKRWYSDAGTPRLKFTDDFKDGVYTITFTQETMSTPGQSAKPARVIPIALGLLNPNGDEVLPTTVLEMTEARQSFVFKGLGARPIASILRGFSAPVILEHPATLTDRAFLLAHDTDPFNRWEAGRALAKDVLVQMVANDRAPDPGYFAGLDAVLRDDRLDPAFRALCLRLPSEDDIAQTLYDAGITPDPARIHAQTRALHDALADRLAPILPGIFRQMQVPGPYSSDAESAGARSLRQACLALLTRLDGGDLAVTQFRAADNMTESTGALACLLEAGQGAEELAEFYARWQHNRLVIDKWFMLQVLYAAPDATADTAKRLTEHPNFDWKNPNRFRSVLGALTANHAGFHDASGASYRLLADWLIRLDPINPQTTARMTTGYETAARYDADRRALIRAELDRIRSAPDLSRDTAEMVNRLLAAI